MPTAIHELFIARVEDAIYSQLKLIREGSSSAAIFAQKVHPARSTEIFFPVDDAPPSIKSKYEPDASFWHDDAQYPGVIIEVAYSQKRKRLCRLAEEYLLDSDASVQVVVGLDIEYGKKGSRKATLSVWRTRVFTTSDGDELRVVQEVEDEVCPNQKQSWSLISDVLHRRFVTTKGTLPIIQAYDFDSETLLTKNLYRMRLEIKIESWLSLLNNSASTLLRRRRRCDTWDHLASIQLLLESRSGKDQRHPQTISLLVMKRGMLSKRREQRSVLRAMTQIMRIHQ